jgi:hypothetical protein
LADPKTLLLIARGLRRFDDPFPLLCFFVFEEKIVTEERILTAVG